MLKNALLFRVINTGGAGGSSPQNVVQVFANDGVVCNFFLLL